MDLLRELEASSEQTSERERTFFDTERREVERQRKELATTEAELSELEQLTRARCC